MVIILRMFLKMKMAHHILPSHWKGRDQQCDVKHKILMALTKEQFMSLPKLVSIPDFQPLFFLGWSWIVLFVFYFFI